MSMKAIIMIIHSYHVTTTLSLWRSFDLLQTLTFQNQISFCVASASVSCPQLSETSIGVGQLCDIIELRNYVSI